MIEALFESDGDGVPGPSPMRRCRSALMGNLWVPSPRAMKELWNFWPITLPRTLTSPRVPKYSADPGITT